MKDRQLRTALTKSGIIYLSGDQPYPSFGMKKETLEYRFAALQNQYLALQNRLFDLAEIMGYEYNPIQGQPTPRPNTWRKKNVKAKK